MSHKQTAERIVLPIICAFAAGVLVALHFVGGENDRLRSEVRRATIALKHASVTLAECGQPEAPGLLVKVAE